MATLALQPNSFEIQMIQIHTEWKRFDGFIKVIGLASKTIFISTRRASQATGMNRYQTALEWDDDQTLKIWDGKRR